jgi:hypothetical protein
MKIYSTENSEEPVADWVSPLRNYRYLVKYGAGGGGGNRPLRLRSGGHDCAIRLEWPGEAGRR